ncbi:MAG: GNAT family N-acetyltransferase [Chloroflexi bacterium]|nr:GNAT family N-acetyltransferase [Chloroflexota bacterium]
MDNAPATREATANDHAKIKEIIDLSFPRFFRFFASHSVGSEEGKVLVAQTHGAVAGFAKLIEFWVGGVKYGCILWIAVHPAARRRGIALALTNAGVDTLKKGGVKAVFASTQRRNVAAQSALDKAGFGRVGFLGLWRLFGWRVFGFYRGIWFALCEVVFVFV